MWTVGTAPTITLLSAIEGGATTTTIVAEAVVIAVVIAEVAPTATNTLTTRDIPRSTILPFRPLTKTNTTTILTLEA